MKNRSQYQKVQGFTVLELLVVLAILGCLMALKLPAVQNSQKDKNEEAAQQYLLAIAEAQTRFQLEDPDGDGRPDFARNLRELIAFGLSPTPKVGYFFSVGTLLATAQDAEDAVYEWNGVAYPVIWGVTGTQLFHIDTNEFLTRTTSDDGESGPLPGLTQVARTIADEIAMYDPSGEAIYNARELLLLHGPAIKRLTDINGDGEVTLEELLNGNILALARAFVREQYPRDGTPVLGDDETLEALLELLFDVLRENLEHADLEQEPVSVRLEDIQGDPTIFFDLPPTLPVLTR